MCRLAAFWPIMLAMVLAVALPRIDARAEKLPMPTVDYAAEGDVTTQMGAAPGTMRHRSGKFRVDSAPNGQETTIFFDLAASTATIVSVFNGRKIAMQIDAAQVENAFNVSTLDAKRLGEDTILGERCDIYEFEVTPGRPMQACITRDGIGLRSHELGRPMWQATRVTRASQDPALFVVPADAVPMQLPRMR
jgi:hypothetical protein